MHHLNNTQKWLCLMLACMLSLSPVNGAQADTPPTSLEIVVVQGEGAIHKIGDRAAEEPIVEVRDQNKHPLTGAAVVFTLPIQGTSGEFGGSKSLTVLTDESGRATANSLRINQIPGKLQIHVNVSYKGQTARAIITQFNMTGPGGKGKTAKSGSTKLLIILAVVGAAAAGGIVAGTRKGGSSSSGGSAPGSPANTAIGITAGTGTVGAP